MSTSFNPNLVLLSFSYEANEPQKKEEIGKAEYNKYVIGALVVTFFVAIAAIACHIKLSYSTLNTVGMKRLCSASLVLGITLLCVDGVVTLYIVRKGEIDKVSPQKTGLIYGKDLMALLRPQDTYYSNKTRLFYLIDQGEVKCFHQNPYELDDEYKINDEPVTDQRMIDLFRLQNNL